MCFGLCELVVAPHRPRATSLPKRKFSFARCFSSNFSSSPSHWLRSERRFYNLNSIIAHNTKRSICWDVWETLESEENEISVREYSFPKKYERDATTFSAKSQKLRFFMYILLSSQSQSLLELAGFRTLLLFVRPEIVRRVKEVGGVSHNSVDHDLLRKKN